MGVMDYRWPADRYGRPKAQRRMSSEEQHRMRAHSAQVVHDEVDDVMIRRHVDGLLHGTEE